MKTQHLFRSARAVVLILFIVNGYVSGQWQYNGSDIYYDDGKVGIGTDDPGERLVVSNSIKAAISFNRGAGSGQIEQNASGGAFRLQNTTGSTIIQFRTYGDSYFNGGNVGIGTTDPGEKLDVAGAVRTAAKLSYNYYAVLRSKYNYGKSFELTVNGGSSNTAELISYGETSGTHFGALFAPSAIVIAYSTGNVGIGTTSPGAKLDVNGTTRTKVIEITGGSDLAEPFEIAGTESIKPGMVVSIDPEQPGELRVSSRAYDRTVAGIISGAGGVSPGILMTQAESEADAAYPVALTGRVYAWADATEGPIKPGDLLTTSDAPGHAMKATDYARSQGTIIGKAMSSLEEGHGLVLVLVALQ